MTQSFPENIFTKECEKTQKYDLKNSIKATVFNKSFNFFLMENTVLCFSALGVKKYARARTI